MSVTAFGSIFLPLVMFVLLFRRGWMPALLGLAAVLQAPAVLVVSWRGDDFGVAPFFVAALATLAALLFDRRVPARPLDPAVQRLLGTWLAFGLVAILGACVLPLAMSGVPVLSPLAKQGAMSDPVPLQWSLNHAAQAFNLGLTLGVMAALAAARARSGMPRRMLIGVVAALAVSVAVGLQQRLAWNGLVPMWEWLWTSNPTYAQNYRSWAGPVPRVSWPMVEASYASAWFAASFGGFALMFLANVHRDKALLGASVSLFALANTLGATGLLATVAVLLALLIGSAAALVHVPACRAGLAYRLALGALAGSCLLLAAYLCLRHYDLVEAARLAFDNVLHGRSRTVLGDLRPHADRHALALLGQSWGLGVGMGSHRASSYLAMLASATGILGLGLFLYAFAQQCRLLARRAIALRDASSVFFLGSSLAALTAAAIAIPDPNWPVLWVLLLGGFACVAAGSQPRRVAAQTGQPVRHGKPHDGPV